MNKSTTRRDRSAYNRALKQAKEAYWAEYQANPDIGAWADFRREYIQKSLASERSPNPRGPRPSDNPSARQQYQQVYQKARRLASKAFAESDALKRQFADFGAYWKERKHTWLPEGFLKGRQPGLEPKKGTPRTQDSQAKDARTNYQIVYKYHSRGWDLNINHCQERFGCWANYWAYLKANAFEAHNLVARELRVEKYDDPRAHDLHGEQLFDVLPKFPKPGLVPTEEGFTNLSLDEQIHRQLEKQRQAAQDSPITRPALPMPVAVYLETDVIPDNSEWLAAA